MLLPSSRLVEIRSFPEKTKAADVQQNEDLPIGIYFMCLGHCKEQHLERVKTGHHIFRNHIYLALEKMAWRAKICGFSLLCFAL